MSRTATSPERRRKVQAQQRAIRKLAADIQANRNRAVPCSCMCHQGQANAHLGQPCQCKVWNRKLAMV